MYTPKFDNTFRSWLEVSKQYLAAGVRPQEINWDTDIPTLLELEIPKERSEFKPLFFSSEFFLRFEKDAKYVSMIRDSSKWTLLYRILYRLYFENKNLLKKVSDPDIVWLYRQRKSLGRDIHKMHAFVRFREMQDAEGESMYVSWFEPEHIILKHTADFFVRRFGDKKWIIATPDVTAYWDLKKIHFSDGVAKDPFETNDAWDDIWKTYYSSIYNKSRKNSKAMMNEMPKKFWKNLPEADLISELLKS